MSDPPDQNDQEAHTWLRQAIEDLDTARRFSTDTSVPPRIACFLAHLAAEKALKAWLIWLRKPFPRIHDLRSLKLLVGESVARAVDDADLDLLNPWAIEGRYPAGAPDATPRDAAACVAAADRVHLVVTQVLGG
jgi:HEPN domain-containing protein